MRKCLLCKREVPPMRGGYIITTKLVSSTTQMKGIKLCKVHSDRLSNRIWNLITDFMRGEGEE